MMAKADWFQTRKYLGWGLTPRSWQGWVFILVILIPYFLLKNNNFLFVWTMLFVIEMATVFVQIKRDEREERQEALADRNALWAMFLGIVAYIIWQSFHGGVIDWKLAVIMLLAVIAKSLTHLYLRDK